MLSYSLYKTMHFIGIFLVFTALGGIATHAANNGAKADNVVRRAVSVMHGTGLLLMLVTGFGMLARMDVSQGAAFPGWVWVKVVIWLGLGAGLALPYRRPQWAKPMLIGLPVLAAIAAVLAIYKPF